MNSNLNVKINPVIALQNYTALRTLWQLSSLLFLSFVELVYLILEPKFKAFFSFEMNEKEMRGQHYTFCSVSPR